MNVATYFLAIAFAGSLVGFWAWVRTRILSIEKDIVVLKEQMIEREKSSAHLLEFLRESDKKIDNLGASVNRVLGRLEEQNARS